MEKPQLPQWVQDAAHRVGEHMKATKVIVFGSFARGTQSRRSDLDLLVIAQTIARPLDRMGEVMRLLSDAPVSANDFGAAESLAQPKRWPQALSLASTRREGAQIAPLFVRGRSRGTLHKDVFTEEDFRDAHSAAKRIDILS